MNNKLLSFWHSTWKGYTLFFVSMLLYAFSGVVVIGLKSVLGGVGQLIFRGLYAALVAFIVLLVIFLVNRKPIKFSKNYSLKYMFLDFVCRPASTLLFVFAVILFADDANKALFYLFSFRVIANLIIDLALKIKTTKWNWIGLALVLVGLVVFSIPWELALLGILCAALSGVVEAVQRKIWNKLGVLQEDVMLFSMYEFLSWFVVATLVYFSTAGVNLEIFSKYPMNLSAFSWTTFGYLTLATVVAVGTAFMDILAFGEEATIEGNVIQSSEMGFAAGINYLWNQTGFLLTQGLGALLMILALVAVSMNKIKKK